MRICFHHTVWIVAFFVVADGRSVARGQSVETPEKTTVCELLNEPVLWNRKLVEVTGFASHGFEDSGFSSPECGGRYGALWMTYGGTKITQTKSTANEVGPDRKKDLKVDGLTVPLVNDSIFKKFDKLLHNVSAGGRIDNLVHATVVARFFAKTETNDSVSGYGHLGCCSLFVIQQVLAVDPLPNTLDVSDLVDYPTAKSVRFLKGFNIQTDILQTQQQAEQGDAIYAFLDPDRVVREALARYLGGSAASVPLHRIHTSSVRITYEGVSSDGKLHYRVVASRPAWLAFYAKNPDKIAWVVIGAYEYGDSTLAGPKVEKLK